MWGTDATDAEAGNEKADKLKLARAFFDNLVHEAERFGLEDYIYDVIDPDYRYKTEELVELFNVDTVKEVLKLGFEKKYGVPLHAEELEERS